MKIASRPFGELAGGRRVELYTLENAAGLTARIMTYGSTLVSIHAPDRNGSFEDVLLGFDALDGYVAPHPYFGAAIGRYANRIARGRFTLEGVTYQLACNDGSNHLHGGRAGFDKRLWTAGVRSCGGEPCLEMHYRSSDGEEGYPGTLDACVRYTLNEAGDLTVGYRARCDRPTIVNLTHHPYFDLSGRGGEHGILDHVLHLPGSRFLPVDEMLIPTGEMQPVHGSCMDFTVPCALRPRVTQADRQLRIAGGGYDHAWVLADAGTALRLAARVHEPISGRSLEVHTTQPGVQFYSGNQLDGAIRGRRRIRYVRHAGFCLEPQRHPDTPNRPSFPSAVLRPGELYEETTIYRFGIAAGA